MLIRPESSQDRIAVFALNAQSFETDSEARLVDAVRDEAPGTISLVADSDGEIVGHIFFSPVALENHPTAPVLGLAPMAVSGQRRNEGIGSSLVEIGLQACRESGAGAVVVLGHPGYYPRFGFRKASDFNISCEYDVPDEVFMAIELEPTFFSGKQGVVKYHPLFSSV